MVNIIQFPNGFVPLRQRLIECLVLPHRFILTDFGSIAFIFQLSAEFQRGFIAFNHAVCKGIRFFLQHLQLRFKSSIRSC